jgi:hypothetical protein
MRERRRRDAEASHSPNAEVEDDSHMDSRADVAGDEASEADAPGTRRSKRSRKAPDVYGDFVALEECARIDGPKRRRCATKEEAEEARRARKAKEARRVYNNSERGKAIRKAYEKSENRKAIRKAYAKSEKGKASRKAYNKSEKGKESQRAYENSERGKASRKAYNKSEKGKESQRAYNNSEWGKAIRKAYNKSEKGKESRRAYNNSEWAKASRKAYEKSEKGKATMKALRKSEKERTAMVKNARVVPPRVQRGLQKIVKTRDITIEDVLKSLVKQKIDPQTAQSVELSRTSPHHTGDASARVDVNKVVVDILESKVHQLNQKFSWVGNKFSNGLQNTSLLSLLTGGTHAVYIGYTAQPLIKEAFAFINRPGKKHGSQGKLYGGSVLEYVDPPQGRKHSRPYVKEAREKLGFVSFAVGTFEDSTVALKVEALLHTIVSHAKSKSRYLGIRLFRELARAPRVFPVAFEREDWLPTVFVTVAEIDLEHSKLSRYGDTLITLNGHAMRVVE